MTGQDTESTNALVLDGSPLGIFDVESVARSGRRVRLDDAGRTNLERAHAALHREMASGEPLYGVNTGFGSFARRRVDTTQLQEVQRNLLRSHASGVGDPLPTETVRAMMLLLAASLSRGCSGVRVKLVECVLGLLNADVTPVVPSIGSVGASGDLAPLAHIGLVLIGEGEAEHEGRRIDGASALQLAGVDVVEPGPKEGLALINGTHLMAAQGALAIADAERVVDAAMCAAAMSIDACRATDAFLDERVYEARGHDGPGRVAARLRGAVAGSEILASHREDDPRVQDPYSLRCAAYVLGAALDALGFVRTMVIRELGAVTDNPLVFGGSEDVADGVVSAGNFHGMPIALPLDVMPMALAHIAGIAERRVYYILAATDPENPLHPHLSPHPGVESGFMIAQYTAAACCNEINTLCGPASVSNIPTCAGVEDYNSFGPRSGAKARRVVDLCRTVVAIELLCASEALEYQRPLRSGPGVERTYATVREVVAPLTEDRSPAPDIAALDALIRAGRFR
jgi:histidine ammonia-lyase